MSLPGTHSLHKTRLLIYETKAAFSRRHDMYFPVIWFIEKCNTKLTPMTSNFALFPINKPCWLHDCLALLMFSSVSPNARAMQPFNWTVDFFLYGSSKTLYCCFCYCIPVLVFFFPIPLRSHTMASKIGAVHNFFHSLSSAIPSPIDDEFPSSLFQGLNQMNLQSYQHFEL